MINQENNICSKLIIINILLKLSILIVVVGIGVILLKGFEHLQNEVFGMKIVIASMSDYLQHGEK